MATIRNPTPFNLFSQPLMRSLDAGEVVDGLTEAEADAACASGVFERGVLVPEEVTVTVTNDEEDEGDEKPKRGRPRTVRGSVEVEETVEEDRETR